MSDHGKTRIYSIVGIGPGTQLNGLFEIDEKIASGGMGEVYRGHEIMSGHPIAIKIVLSELAKDETIVGLFNKEARVLRDFNHPAIVRYMAFGTDPVIGRPYLVMEFIDGPSLSERLESGPLKLEEAKNLFGRLASGLDAAHQLGVVHRDISSDNIILANGIVSDAKIIDFGIARTTKGVTLLEGKFAGKYNFVSPEQLGLFNSVISEATDIYSLGLLMVNALRGVPIDMNGTQLEIIEKRRVVPDISDIDPSIRPIIEAMLQPDPNDRKVTMADIAEWFTPVRERSKPPRQRPQSGSIELSADDAAIVPVDIDLTPQGAKGVSRTQIEAAAKRSFKSPTPEPPDGSPAGASPGNKPPSGRAKPAKAEKSAAEEEQSSQSLEVIAKASEDLSQMAQAAPPRVTGGAAGEESKAPLLALTPKKADAPISEPQGASLPEPVSLPVFLPGSVQNAGEGYNPSSKRAGGVGKSALAAGIAAVVGLGFGIWWFSSGPSSSTNETELAAAPKLTPSATGPAETRGTQIMPATSVEAAKTNPLSAGTEAKPEAQETELAARQSEDPNIKTGNGPAPPPQSKTNQEYYSWVRSYQGGECFYARAVSGGEQQISIEGMGVSADAFERLDKEFQKKFNFEPQIQVRKIVNAQCGVASFLAGMASDELPVLKMGLDNDRVKSRERLKGTLTGLKKPNVVLYLVDNEGTIHQFDRLLKRSGENGSFSIKLVDLETRSPLPQLVLALSSDKPIKGAALRGPVNVDALMPVLANQIQKDGIDFEYAFAFFLLGGS